eukprot:CAMPEP_0113703866 /NCGR_PEP_ID=MMETSP0038_2-20120614/26145_1 /TAXON_ID=2898 /ORGANISM="Cryptomonas paramecium" /LENGTH=180 /DNA_ID=CAMNT_0000628471 /DNA_START=63 /DNA_END=601 /DNA_ORIENTATION=+ /assembly_acc=CAM_ASM_000170
MTQVKECSRPAQRDAECTVTPRPRNRARAAEDDVGQSITLTSDDLQNFYHLNLVDAARSLRISCSSLKTICRRLGIYKWPFREVRKAHRKKMQASRSNTCTSNSFAAVVASNQQRQSSSEASQSPPDTADEPSSPEHSSPAAKLAIDVATCHAPRGSDPAPFFPPSPWIWPAGGEAAPTR